MLWSDDLKTNHKFNFKDSKIFAYIHNKKYRKIVKSSLISNYNTTEQKI